MTQHMAAASASRVAELVFGVPGSDDQLEWIERGNARGVTLWRERAVEFTNSAQRGTRGTPTRRNSVMRSHRRLLGEIWQPLNDWKRLPRLESYPENCSRSILQIGDAMLLNDFAIGVADFDFAKVEFFHFVFDFGAVAYGDHGDLVWMNVFLRCGLGLLGIHGVYGIGKF